MSFTRRIERKIKDVHENFRLENAGWLGTHQYGDGRESVHYIYVGPYHSHNFLVEVFNYYRGEESLDFYITTTSQISANALWKKLKKAGFNTQGPTDETVDQTLRENSVISHRGVVSVKLSEQPTNATYIDDFLAICRSIVEFPAEIIQDVKEVIAETCVIQFKKKLEQGKSFTEAASNLRHCALQGVSSPYFLAAQSCPKFANVLLAQVPLEHHESKIAHEQMVPPSTASTSTLTKTKVESSTVATAAATTTTTTTAVATTSSSTSAATPPVPPIIYAGTVALQGSPFTALATATNQTNLVRAKAPKR